MYWLLILFFNLSFRSLKFDNFQLYVNFCINMNILGISTGHDSGACIVVDGKIVAAINEERLSRIKNNVGFPLRSIEKVLLISNIKVSDLHYIAIEGNKVDPQYFGEEFLFKNKKKNY